MKKIIFSLIIITTFSQNAFSENYSRHRANTLPDEVYNKLYDEVEKILSKCCQNFNGTYKWGEMKMLYVIEEGNNLQVEGVISYRGRSCGNVTTDYYVTFNQKTGVPSKWCIYTPYCFMGMQTSKEWDCNCAEYYTTRQKMQFVFKSTPNLIKFFQEHRYRNEE